MSSDIRVLGNADQNQPLPDSLEKQIDDKNKEIQKLNGKINDFVVQQVIYSDSVAMLLKENDNLRGNNKQLNEQNKKIIDENNDFRDKIKCQDDTIQRQDDKIKCQDEKIDALAKEIEKLKTMMDADK